MQRMTGHLQHLAPLQVSHGLRKGAVRMDARPQLTLPAPAPCEDCGGLLSHLCHHPRECHGRPEILPTDIPSLVMMAAGLQRGSSSEMFATVGKWVYTPLQTSQKVLPHCRPVSHAI